MTEIASGLMGDARGIRSDAALKGAAHRRGAP